MLDFPASALVPTTIPSPRCANQTVVATAVRFFRNVERGMNFSLAITSNATRHTHSGSGVIVEAGVAPASSKSLVDRRIKGLSSIVP
jgi:hypothetical protein